MFFSPFLTFVVGGALVGFVAVAAYVLVHVVRGNEGFSIFLRRDFWSSTVVLAAVCAVVSLFTVGPFFFELVRYRTMFITPDGEVAGYTGAAGAFYWESDPIFNAGVLNVELCSDSVTRLNSCVARRVVYTPPAPITANPHVVWHEHSIVVKRQHGPEAAVKWALGVRSQYGSTQAFVNNHIIEMSRLNSSLLIQMDNPYAIRRGDEPSAQERYESMARDYFEPFLADVGLEFVSASFALRQP